MAFLNPTTGTHFHISSMISFFSPNYTTTIHIIKNPPNPTTSLSKFFLYPSFSLKIHRNFRVSAHFGRGTSRKNYLRKKLTQSQPRQQVSQNPTIHNPSSNFENSVDEIVSDSDRNSQLNANDSLVDWGSKEGKIGPVEDALDGLGSDELKVPDIESDIKNELNSFIDQYNADSDFWGIGSGPIFTVYENSDGKLERVDVDEAEILRRSEIEPSLYEDKELQLLKDLNPKIAHAKYLAREMENGSNVLSRNSSVANFVKSGQLLGFVSMIHRFTLDKPGMLSKWSIVGLTGLFGLVLVLGWKRLFTSKRGEEGYRPSPSITKRDEEAHSPSPSISKGGKDGYTPVEKEMLRRKMKARMEREKLVKGSVEVIQDFKNPEIEFRKRPQLNKDDLRNAIVNVTGENGNLGFQLLFDTQSNNSMEFERKIGEIRRMARHARESEKNATVQGGIYDNDKDDNQIAGDISNVKEVIDVKFTSLDNQLADNNGRPPFDKQDLMNNVANLSLKVPSVIPVSESIDFDGKLKEKEKIVNGLSNAPQVDDTKSLIETPYPRSSKSEVNTVKAKPRIIKSVKEATEYLSKKYDKREQNQETEVRNVQEVNINVNIQSKVGNLGSQQLNGTADNVPMDFASQIKEIREMDRSAQNVEETDTLRGNIGHAEDRLSVSEFSNEKDVMEIKSTSLNDAVANDTERLHIVNTGNDLASNLPSDILTRESVNSDGEIKEMTEIVSNAREIKRKDSLVGDGSKKVKERQTVNGFSNEKKVKVKKMKATSLNDPLGGDNGTLGVTPRIQPNKPGKSSGRVKPRIIKSVKEAREYLSQKRDNQEQNQETKVRTVQEVDTNVNTGRVGINGGSTSQNLGKNGSTEFVKSTSQNLRKNGSTEFVKTTRAPGDTTCTPEDNNLKRKKAEKGSSPTKDNKYEDCVGVTNDEITRDTASSNKENWVKKNHHELEPILQKIRDGFEQNYMVAKETVNEDTNITAEMLLPRPDEDGELEWMKDDRLREIVFKVRENELTGRDPFYLMDDEDKRMFFEGLEKKVEKVNEELVNLHQWVHSNVENLDYGAGGISVHDSPEKMVPRWKGPPLDTTPAVLDDYLDQRKALFPKKSTNSNLVKRDGQDMMQKSQESPTTSSGVNTSKKKSNGMDPKSKKTVIEGSDGSVRDGKKTGKEFWEHTRKWSRGFLEIYNAETDPETKSAMKDMGKDLDRWYTEKEIQEAADMVKNVPEKGQKFIKEKLEKVKREMELYGPHAVVSKYGEFTEEKEVDYLWWLDLPVVMGIEICTDEDGDKRSGLYSLEMGADLELEPKPHHLIAFEDKTDSQNFRYIIQSQLDMRGSGSEAFVVAQYPKDAYRDAKASGFKVTVIRKGELKLNVDQTLEEIEERITEIGSKMYHDQITKGRSINMDSLMKGVFGIKNKPTQRKRSKRRLKKPKQ